jgi:hypothetical protein
VALPVGSPGKSCTIKNAGAEPLIAYPRLGDGARFNDQPINDGVIIQPQAMLLLMCESLTQWHF